MNFTNFIKRKFQTNYRAHKREKNDKPIDIINSQNNTSNSIDFSVEENRIKSFEQWTGLIHKNFLAKNGFFYLGYNDAVKCHSCNLQLQEWDVNDNPDYIHRLLSKNCKHLENCDIMSDQYIRCIVCIENIKEICLLPCAHLLFCENCSQTIFEECPLCKSKISQKIKIFI